MIHPSVEVRYINAHIGYGVFAKTFIPKGTITWVQDKLDGVFTDDQVENFDRLEFSMFDRYAYMNGEQKFVLCWDAGKYMNHHCNPNILSSGFHFDIAIRDITQEQELVTDYALLNIDEIFHCDCGYESCRRSITSNEADKLVANWDIQINEAFQLIGSVEQPLWSLLETKKEVEKCIHAPSLIPSSAKNLIPMFR